MKAPNSREYLILFMLYFVVLLSFSCDDKLQEEIDQLKATNAELLLQIDINSSTITDLELQKAALEAQKGDWQADTALINTLIKKVDRILISKHVERYLSFIVGQEDFSRHSWQHFYDEDLFLIQSDYQITQSDSFSWFYITGGETSMPVKSQFIHDYDDGLLVSSESEKMFIDWTIAEGRVAEIIVTRKENHDEYTWYLTSKTNGNIIESTYFKGDVWTNKSVFNYNDQNLLVKIDVTHYIDGNSQRLFDYDEDFNLLHYQLYIDEVLHTNVTWDYNSVGKLTKYYSENPWEIDSIGISYLSAGEWEVYFMRLDKDSNSKNINVRIFDAMGHIISYFSQKDDEYPFFYESEYLDNNLVKYVSYGYKQSPTLNEWYLSQIQTTSMVRDENGVITDRNFEDVYYNEDKSVISGTLNVHNGIVWSNNERNMLEYSEEKYNLFPTILYEKTDFVKVEHADLNQIYDKKISEYYINNGEAIFIEYTFEITEFYNTSPFAPKVKVEKWFDANGVTSSLTYYNDNNSTYNWNWIFQN